MSAVISTRPSSPIALSIMLIFALTSACTSQDSKPLQLFRLSADSGYSAVKSGKTTNWVIGLGPIHIPKYLDRTQIVTAVSEHQYQLSDNQRWAEPLDQNITLALLKALPDQLGTDRIIAYPWPQRLLIDYQIGIEILEFNADQTGQNRLLAQWFIKHNDQIIVNKRFDYHVSAAAPGYEEQAKAQSACLSKLGQEIAETLVKQSGYLMNPPVDPHRGRPDID